MKRITIAMADIVQGDMHILQHRNHDPSKAAAGLIGFFGGQVEVGESAEQALERELSEEMIIDTKRGKLAIVGSFATSMEHKGEVLEIVGDCFRLEMPPGAQIEAQEGEIVKMSGGALVSRIEKMSPATAAVINQYYMKGNQ